METDHGTHPVNAPWAHVRLVDPDGRPDAECNRCGAGAILQFKADYDVTGIVFPAEGATLATDVPEVSTETVPVDIYACRDHAGELAFAAAYAVAAGPTGAV